MPYQTLNILDLEGKISKNGKNCRFKFKQWDLASGGTLFSFRACSRRAKAARSSVNIISIISIAHYIKNNEQKKSAYLLKDSDS